MMSSFSHLDKQGQANMVDVSGKATMLRRARARGKIVLLPATIDLVRANRIAKGNVLTVARIAGIQAAKETGRIIPLCHPLVLDRIDVRLTLNDKDITAESEVICHGRTGVEMEALNAVCVALLTVYDMCKAVDKQMHLENIVLLEKVKENVT